MFSRFFLLQKIWNDFVEQMGEEKSKFWNDLGEEEIWNNWFEEERISHG